MAAAVDDETLVKRLADNLGRIMEKKGLNQPALAKKAGVPIVAISRMARGMHMPGVGAVYRVASALSVKVDELFRPH